MSATDMHTLTDLEERQGIAIALPTLSGSRQAGIQKRVATSSVARTSLMAPRQFRTQFALSRSRNAFAKRATNGQSGISTYRVSPSHPRVRSESRSSLILPTKTLYDSLEPLSGFPQPLSVTTLAIVWVLLIKLV